MVNDFSKIMSSKSIEELVEITQVNRDDYQEAALESAEKELANRNISKQEIEETTQRIIRVEKEKTIIKNNTVSIGIRFLNFLIDSFVWLVIVFALTFPLNAHNSSHRIIGYFIIIVSYFLYYTIFEIKYQRTLGKVITKTKVVAYSEDTPSNIDIIVRSISRFIPLDHFSFLFTRNGIHDMFSKTKVIKVDSQYKIKPLTN